MSRLTDFAWMIVAAALATIIPTIATAARPAATHMDDLGRFVVTRAIVYDNSDPRQDGIFNDDPRYVGRVVTIHPDRVGFAYEEACPRVARNWYRATVRKTLREIVTGPGSQERRNLWSDPALRNVSTRPVAVVRYQCTGLAQMRDRSIGEAWGDVFGFPLGASSRGLSWGVGLLLVLEPVPTKSAIRASFPCARAAKPAERTICADPALAGWDRSLATAFQLARSGGGPDRVQPVADTAALLQGQQAWLLSRDTCGTNRQCLADRMSTRTATLVELMTTDSRATSGANSTPGR